MPNSLDADQARRLVGPDLGPNCLKMLSADDTSRLLYTFRNILPTIVIIIKFLHYASDTLTLSKLSCFNNTVNSLQFTTVSALSENLSLNRSKINVDHFSVYQPSLIEFLSFRVQK